MNDTERLERIYNVAARELRRMLYSLEGSKYTAMAAGAAHNRALEITRVLNVTVDNWAGEAIPRAYKKGAAVARTALEILGKKPLRPPFEDKRRRLQDDLVVLLIKANNSIPTIVDRYLASAMMAERAVQGAQLQEFSFDDVKDDVEAMAKKAVQTEASRGELSRTVRDYLRDQIGQGEFLEIKGRSYKMNKYAELVGRTTMRDAQTAATLDLCHQYENDLVQVSSHGTVCEICAQYEGKVYSISGKTLGYPILDARTPFHPNCEHSLLPTSLEAIAEEPTKEVIPKWKPSMTLEQADLWAKDSIIKDSLFHKTSLGAAESIAKEGFVVAEHGGMYGTGIYTSLVPEGIYGNAFVELRINVKKVLLYTDDLPGKARSWWTASGHTALTNNSAVLHDYAIAHGYEAIKISQFAETRTWYVIFEPKNITVIKYGKFIQPSAKGG